MEDFNIEADRRAIDSISAIPVILDMICRTTGMGYATVARVTQQRWVACAVLDNINFNLPAGGELKVETTLCHEVEQYHKGIIIDNFSESEEYANHHTPALYGLQSYISIPINLKDGRFFGTLCAINPRPAQLNTPEIIGMFNLYAELIAVHIDNFERVELAEAKLMEEKQVAELREQFIAVLGHDLRNPVGAVRNVAQLLQRGVLDEAGIKRFAGVLMNSSHRMTALIENVMDFARGRLGSGITVNIKPEGLQDILNHVIDELQLIWPDRVIVADFNLPKPINADGRRIAQLFSNLLSNALSHGDPESPVFVRAEETDQQFLLEVSNKGEPIPPQIMNKLFEPFARLQDGNDKEGLGLGLYISAEIARAHKGWIEVQSDDQETKFTFEIPLDA